MGLDAVALKGGLDAWRERFPSAGNVFDLAPTSGTSQIRD
jgi:hypothetical protein